MARVAVAGAGVGGLAAAIRLRAQGHDVSVFERNRVGGKLGSQQIDGFTFDTGPSLLTLPDEFHDLFAVSGESLDDHVALVRLAHPFRHTFSDRSTLDLFDNESLSRFSFNQFVDGDEGWQAMSSHTERVWNTATRTFFSGPMESPLNLLQRMQSVRDLHAIDALRTLNGRSTKLFTDPRLQAWLNRFATYSGSSPFSAPATLSCIAHVEQQFGSWHVIGGLGKLAEALEIIATKVGVTITHGSVDRVVTADSRATGLVVDGVETNFDIVVCNTNAEHLYSELLPAIRKMKRARRAGRSSSVFAMLLGVDGSSDGMTHHNVYYSSNQRAEFDEIFHGKGIASEPTIYVCNPSATDASLAPSGSESWFVLVNVAAGASADWNSYGDMIIKRLGASDRVRVRRQLTPGDLEASFGDPGGAIYGTSSNSKRSAFLRASNRGPVKGLYLCGGSAHPGGGLPLVAMSGKIVAEMISQDFPQ